MWVSLNHPLLISLVNLDSRRQFIVILKYSRVDGLVLQFGMGGVVYLGESEFLGLVYGHSCLLGTDFLWVVWVVVFCDILTLSYSVLLSPLSPKPRIIPILALIALVARALRVLIVAYALHRLIVRFLHLFRGQFGADLVTLYMRVIWMCGLVYYADYVLCFEDFHFSLLVFRSCCHFSITATNRSIHVYFMDLIVVCIGLLYILVVRWTFRVDGC